VNIRRFDEKLFSFRRIDVLFLQRVAVDGGSVAMHPGAHHGLVQAFQQQRGGIAWRTTAKRRHLRRCAAQQGQILAGQVRGQAVEPSSMPSPAGAVPLPVAGAGQPLAVGQAIGILPVQPGELRPMASRCTQYSVSAFSPSGSSRVSGSNHLPHRPSPCRQGRGGHAVAPLLQQGIGLGGIAQAEDARHILHPVRSSASISALRAW
jgi:hypothetical protein